jgi:hypothetical protein
MSKISNTPFNYIIQEGIAACFSHCPLTQAHFTWDTTPLLQGLHSFIRNTLIAPTTALYVIHNPSNADSETKTSTMQV